MKLLYFFLILIGYISCGSDRFNIEGILPDFGNEKIMLVTLQDSIITEVFPDKEGKFLLTGKIRHPELLYIKAVKGRLNVPLYLEPARYSLKRDGKYNYLLSAEAGTEQERYQNFLTGMEELEKTYNRLASGYSGSEVAMEAKVLLSGRLDSLHQIRMDRIIEGVSQFSDTPLGYLLAERYLLFLERDFNAFSRVMTLLDENEESPLRERIYSEYELLKSKQLIGEAPDFELPDMEGKKVALSSFRGKYVLLDFWASWCAPCRKKNKELNERYTALKGTNLEIISVSLDENEEDWKRAVRSDGVQWLQLVDLAGFSGSGVRADYKFEQVPAVFLIDPEGRVVRANPEWDEIIEIVESK